MNSQNGNIIGKYIQFKLDDNTVYLNPDYVTWFRYDNQIDRTEFGSVGTTEKYFADGDISSLLVKQGISNR